MSEAETLSVFIHSTGTRPSMWDAVPAEVIGTTRKLAPPNLGYPPLAPLLRGQRVTAADEAAHLLAMIGESPRVHLYAHSYGASVALDLAHRLGPRLASLFTFEPVFFGALALDAGSDPAAVAEAMAFDEHPWFLHDEAVGGTDAWLEHFIDYWNRPGSWARMPESMKDESRAVAWKMYQEVRSCFFDVKDFGARPFPEVPCTIATGERSTRGARAMAQALHRRNPHATFVEIAGAGHMAPLTRPDLVAPALIDHARRAGVG
ncbi:MAG: alpha/beta hydrolase [Byssovorax sp.]